MVVRTSALPALLIPWSRDRSQYFACKHGRDLWADPAQLHQLAGLGVRGGNGVALGLNRVQLREHQFKAVKLAKNILLYGTAERSAVARHQRVKPLASVGPQRMKIKDAVRRQEAPDAVYMGHTLPNQAASFPVKAFGLLLFWGRNLNQAPHLPVASCMRHQGA